MCPRPSESRNAGWREIESGAAGPISPAPHPSRAARLPRFLSGQADPGDLLDRLGVTLVGAGAVGRNIAFSLARLMIGRLRIVDSGRFKAESLLTQAILPADIGQPKAGNAAAACKAISPRSRVLAFDGPVEALETTALADTDLVLLATDNLLAELEVGQRCLHLKKPLVQAAVHGETLTAQVRFFGNAVADSPCPACGFNTAEWDHLNNETTFSCEGVTGSRPVARSRPAPTMSVSFLCSLAADLALMQVLRFVAGLGGPVENTLLEYCGYTHRTAISPLGRRPDCPADHVAWEPGRLPAPLAECSLAELTRRAGFEGDAQASFLVDEMRFVQSATCSAGHQVSVDRFLPAVGDIGRCTRCDRSLCAQPFYSHRPVTASRLGERRGRPLGEICGVTPRWVVVRNGERGVLFHSRHGERGNEV
jgi:molybdopterin/thiamine biosynthesis adenylyltransferase